MRSTYQGDLESGTHQGREARYPPVSLEGRRAGVGAPGGQVSRSLMQRMSEPQLWLFLCLPSVSKSACYRKTNYYFLKTQRCAWH